MSNIKSIYILIIKDPLNKWMALALYIKTQTPPFIRALRPNNLVGTPQQK
jgi:hypothetical protein